MNEPEYYTRSGLIAAAGVSRATFARHRALNVGGINDAAELIPGLRFRFKASKCRKYLALCHANSRHRSTTQPITP